MSRTLRRYLSREAKGTEATFHRDSSSAPPPHHPVSFYTLYRSNRETLLAVYIGGARAFVRVGGAPYKAPNTWPQIAAVVSDVDLFPAAQARRSIARGAIHRAAKRGFESLNSKERQRLGYRAVVPGTVWSAWRDRALPPHFESVTLYSPIECGQGRNSSALFCDFRTNCPVVSALL